MIQSAPCWRAASTKPERYRQMRLSRNLERGTITVRWTARAALLLADEHIVTERDIAHTWTAIRCAKSAWGRQLRKEVRSGAVDQGRLQLLEFRSRSPLRRRNRKLCPRNFARVRRVSQRD